MSETAGSNNLQEEDAIEIAKLCNEASSSMNAVLLIAEDRITGDMQRIFRQEAATIMGEIYARLIRRVHDVYPDLKPDYLR